MTETQLDATFAALADPTRRAIIARLAEGPAPVGELAIQVPGSASAGATKRSIARTNPATISATASIPLRIILRLLRWARRLSKEGKSGGSGITSIEL